MNGKWLRMGLFRFRTGDITNSMVRMRAKEREEGEEG
jgi:hypothetical protein